MLCSCDHSYGSGIQEGWVLLVFLGSSGVCYLWNSLLVQVLSKFGFVGSKFWGSLGILTVDRGARSVKVTSHGFSVMVLHLFTGF